MFISYNPNPDRKLVGDCVIRAITKVTDKTWDEIYMDICLQGFSMKDMPSSNAVWGAYLYSQGFKCKAIPDTCPDCYTVKQFCKDNLNGVFLLATGSHVVAVVNGDYYDSWDSGDEIPIYYYWRRET
jgi:hypothetical protein